MRSIVRAPAKGKACWLQAPGTAGKALGWGGLGNTIPLGGLGFALRPRALGEGAKRLGQKSFGWMEDSFGWIETETI